MRTNKAATPVVTIEESILIGKPVGEVFACAGNLANDGLWRKEIKKTTVGSGPGAGAIVVQESFLSAKVPAYAVTYVCTSYVPGEEVVFETTDTNELWQANSRRFTRMGDSSTLFRYQVSFEQRIVAIGLGFMLPVFIIKWYTRATMKQYLKKLRDNQW